MYMYFLCARMHEGMHVRVGMYARASVCMYVDGRMDGWMDGWTDGRMDGWTDGRTHRCMDT